MSAKNASKSLHINIKLVLADFKIDGGKEGVLIYLTGARNVDICMT